MTSTAHRFTQLASTVTGSAKANVIAKNEDDVVIVSALRTAITKVALFLSTSLLR